MAALFAVLCLAALCWGSLGQTTMMSEMVDPTSTMDVAMPMTSSVSPATTNIPTMASFGSVATNETVESVISARTASQLNEVYDPMFGASGTSRFDNPLSSNIRRNYYFNCVVKDSSGITTFPTATALEGNVLSIYFQMPVLFYLDFEIRGGLMHALRNATGSSRLCIYRHQDFRVSYFEEGVLLTVFDYNTVMGTANLNGQALLDSFLAYRGRMPFTSFLGRSAVNLAYGGLYDGGIVPAPLARRAGDDGDFEVSPTTVRQHAMILYYTAGCPELYDVASEILNSAAENPNAINLYLVAGDYVFIVIGAILTFSVLVLTIIGFVIHPYFLG